MPTASSDARFGQKAMSSCCSGKRATSLAEANSCTSFTARSADVPPQLDLTKEAALQRVLVDGAASGVIRSAHDCVEGGVAVTLAECCFDTPLGVERGSPRRCRRACKVSRHCGALFRVRVTRRRVCRAGAVGHSLSMAQKAGVPATVIGRVGGNRIQIAVEGRPVINELVSDAERIWATSIESWFEQRRAIA